MINTTVLHKAVEERLLKEMPGLQIRRDYSRMLLNLGVTIYINAGYEILPDDEHYLEGYMKLLVEQLRIKAVRELGLQPRLDAYEREALEIRRGNEILQNQLKAAKEKIGELELTIQQMEEAEDEQ